MFKQFPQIAQQHRPRSIPLCIPQSKLEIYHSPNLNKHQSQMPVSTFLLKHFKTETQPVNA